MSPEVSAKDAARRLGVDDSRVRQLLGKGELPGRKVADRWVVDLSALERRKAMARERGRLMEPRNAWGLLFLASGESAQWLASDARSRLRRCLREGWLRTHHVRLGRRARTHYFAAGDRARADIARDPRFIRSGVSAAPEYSADVRAPRVLEGYLPEDDLQKAVYRHALRPVDEREADLVLHAVSGFWPFQGRKIAPRAVVAVDLVDSLDQRSRRAGEALLQRLAP